MELAAKRGRIGRSLECKEALWNIKRGQMNNHEIHKMTLEIKGPEYELEKIKIIIKEFAYSRPSVEWTSIPSYCEHLRGSYRRSQTP